MNTELSDNQRQRLTRLLGPRFEVAQLKRVYPMAPSLPAIPGGSTLNLVLQNRDAQYIEIHFGLTKENETVLRHMLRLSDDGFEIGRAQSDQDGVFELSQRLQTAIKDFTGPVTVRLERQPTGWFVAIKDYPAAAMPLNDKRELPMIQFAARRDKCWFSDISLVELKVRD